MRMQGMPKMPGMKRPQYTQMAQDETSNEYKNKNKTKTKQKQKQNIHNQTNPFEGPNDKQPPWTNPNLPKTHISVMT